MTDRVSLLKRLIKTVAERSAKLPLAERVGIATCDIAGADGASVTIANPAPHRLTLCATDERSRELDNLQDVLGEGPCQDAFRSQLPVSTGVDRWAVARWPAFIPAAERVIGPAGVLWSLPMHAGRKVIGTVNLYRLSGAVLAEPIDAAQALADAVTVLLVRDPAMASQYGGGARLPARSVVHQAVGILMAQLRLGPDDAMALLRAHAFAAGAQLAQVAQNVLDGSPDLSDL
jgi:hypothetical protein